MPAGLPVYSDACSVTHATDACWVTHATDACADACWVTRVRGRQLG